MFRLSGNVVVPADPARVSAFLADVSNEPKWQKGIVHVQLVDGRAGERGAKYERVQVVAGRNIKTLNELVELIHGKAVAFEASGKVIKYRLAYTLARAANGTQVGMALEGEMLGFASMFEGMAADELRDAIPADLERLRAALV